METFAPRRKMVYHLSLIHIYVVDLVLVLLQSDLVQLSLHHLHGVLAVLQLAALGLAARHNAGGLVDQADGGGRLVDVLAACTGGAVDLHLDVGGVDFNVDVVVQLGHDLKAGETGLAAGVGVKRADAHQTVDAVLALCLLYTSGSGAAGFPAGRGGRTGG